MMEEPIVDPTVGKLEKESDIGDLKKMAEEADDIVNSKINFVENSIK